MTTRIAINGFGRIGRLIFRIAAEKPNLEIVAINDVSDTQILAHLLKYDSIHGKFSQQVELAEEGFMVNGQLIRVLGEKEPQKLPWKELGVDIVYECTGRFTTKETAGQHLAAGAKKVIISAPAKDAEFDVVMGVNHERYDPSLHHIISNASCTTNCLAPFAKVIQDHFGIKRGLMTTIHAYTNDQVVQDFPHKDYRRARAAGENLIPTTTGAAQAVAKVIPELQGKFSGFAVRVPSANVSLVDMVLQVKQAVTVEEVNGVFKRAAEGPLQGILAYSEEPLVSSDYKGDPHSCTIDALSTMVLQETMVKIVAWYDNEWAYSNRMVDLVEYMITKGL